MSETIFIDDLVRNKKKSQHSKFPDKAVAESFIDEIFDFLFIGSSSEGEHKAVLQKYDRLKNNARGTGLRNGA